MLGHLYVLGYASLFGGGRVKFVEITFNNLFSMEGKYTLQRGRDYILISKIRIVDLALCQHHDL